MYPVAVGYRRWPPRRDTCPLVPSVTWDGRPGGGCSTCPLPPRTYFKGGDHIMSRVYRRLKETASRVKRELMVYQLLLRDSRTPRAAKLLLAAAVAYALSPIDLIPDFIPVLGFVDDFIIVPGLVLLALKLVPTDVVRDCRMRAGFA